MSVVVKIRFFIGIFLLSSFLTKAYAQSYGLSLADNRKVVTIPFELYNNLIVVQVKYNKLVNLNFILDTGVRSAILTDARMALLLNPRYVRSVKVRGLGGGSEVDAVIASGLDFTMAGLQGKEQLLVVLMEDVFSLSRFIGKEVHGLLGYEIFSRFVVEINYRDKVLKLYEPSVYRYKGKGDKLPMTVEDTKPFVDGEVKIKGKTVPVKLIIDSGAGHPLALYTQSHKDIVLPDTTIQTLLGRGISGDITGSLGRVESFQLGEEQLHHVLTSFPDSASLGGSFNANNRQGSLGADILNRFIVTFNYHDNYVVLQKWKKKDKGFHYNMSGIDVICEGDDLKTFVVGHVRPSSPAARAGILIRDEIIAINGKSSKEYDLSRIHNLFQQKPGKKVRLKIQRGDEVLKKLIVLENII